MSVQLIRTAAATLLAAVPGVFNVDEEEPIALDTQRALDERIYNGRGHFWLVKARSLVPAGGIGYNELHHHITIEGFIEVAREQPDDGVASDVTAMDLLSLVVNEFVKRANRTLTGTCLNTGPVTPEPVSIITRRIGMEDKPGHRLALSFTAIEDGTA